MACIDLPVRTNATCVFNGMNCVRQHIERVVRMSKSLEIVRLGHGYITSSIEDEIDVMVSVIVFW